MTLFYEPHFSGVARRFHEIQSKGDQAAVQRFVDECEQSRLDRLKARRLLPLESLLLCLISTLVPQRCYTMVPRLVCASRST